MQNLQKQKELLAGFKNNDPVILKGIYKKVFPMVKAYVLKNNGNEAHAKDLFQEAFVACWKNIKADKFQGGNLEAYLYTISKNKWTDYLRSSGFKNTVSENEIGDWYADDEAYDHEKEKDDLANQNALQAALKQLGAGCRELLDLFYFQKKSMEEMAVKLGLGAASIRNKKYRCMERLRTLALKIRDNE